MPIASKKEVAGLVARGVCMGAADVVPGVSGGTVALIVGIYGRLVTAISQIDRTFCQLLLQRKWKEAANHIDLGFLVALGCGIIVGFLIMTGLVHSLLTHPDSRALTLSVFFGMILASAFLVGGLIQPRDARATAVAVVLGLIGAALAYGVMQLEAVRTGEPSLVYLFMCGAIAICAMILPGVSGAMVLVLLGVYIYLTEIPKHLLHGEQIGLSLITIAVFGSGCAVGLISFSKVLRWLLTKYHSFTMAVLCGFMFGALPKVWPFQRDLTPGEEDFKLKHFEPQLPASFDNQFFAVCGMILISVVAVIAVDRFARRRAPKPAGS